MTLFLEVRAGSFNTTSKTIKFCFDKILILIMLSATNLSNISRHFPLLTNTGWLTIGAHDLGDSSNISSLGNLDKIHEAAPCIL